MSLSPAAEQMTRLGAPRWSLFFLIKPSAGPWVRAWGGLGDYTLPADEVDEEGGTYLGIGLLAQVPAVRQLVGGVAERVDFVLNGVDPVTFGLADENASTVRSAPVHVGIVFFDQDWQPADPVAWLWEGTADTPGVDRDADPEGGIVRRVSLSVGTVFTDRTRPQPGFYTDADQRRRSPDDSFCSRVAGYSFESTVTWPRF